MSFCFPDSTLKIGRKFRPNRMSRLYLILFSSETSPATTKTASSATRNTAMELAPCPDTDDLTFAGVLMKAGLEDNNNFYPGHGLKDVQVIMSWSAAVEP